MFSLIHLGVSKKKTYLIVKQPKNLNWKDQVQFKDDTNIFSFSDRA